MIRPLYSPLGRTARDKYFAQRRGAAQRGIEWQFTFDDWLRVWIESGHWRERGGSVYPRGYVMGRFGDVGPYSPGNVEIITHAENSRNAVIYRRNRPASNDSAIVKRA